MFEWLLVLAPLFFFFFLNSNEPGCRAGLSGWVLAAAYWLAGSAPAPASQSSSPEQAERMRIQ
jgi:hypothetical protein